MEPKNRHVISLTTKTCMKLGVIGFLVVLGLTWWKPMLRLMGDILSAAIPLIIGFAMAYVVNILMTLFERHYFKKQADKKWVKKSRRAVCLICAIITVLGAVVLLLWIVIPQLMDAITVISKTVPDLLTGLSTDEKFMSYLPEGIQDAILRLDYEALVQGVIGFFTNGSTDSGSIGLQGVAGLVGSLTSGFMAVFMGFIFSIYILISKEKLLKQFGRLGSSYLSRGWMDRIAPFFNIADDCFHSFIVGQIVEGIVIGVLCAVGMALLRLPYAAMVGAVVGVTALIPVLGCYIGAIIGALMCLSVSPMKALIFIIFIFVLQQVESNLIYPRVVGTSLGLPGMWVLAAVAVGGGVGGILGMLISVPIAATAYRLLSRSVRNRELHKDEHRTAADYVDKLREETEQ